MKTLEQREAEYAEARMRIFGASGMEPEPDSNGSNSVSVENCAEPASEMYVSRDTDRLLHMNKHTYFSIRPTLVGQNCAEPASEMYVSRDTDRPLHIISASVTPLCYRFST